jgi:hypothetical protein
MLVRQTRLRYGIERSTGYTEPKVSVPTALTWVPAWYRFSRAGYRESTQKTAAIATMRIMVSERLRHVPESTNGVPKFRAEVCTAIEILPATGPFGGQPQGVPDCTGDTPGQEIV